MCSKEDLDLSVKLGLGFPEGILQMADRWGIDRVVVFLKAKQDMYGKDYAPDQLLEEMLREGGAGRFIRQRFLRVLDLREEVRGGHPEEHSTDSLGHPQQAPEAQHDHP